MKEKEVKKISPRSVFFKPKNLRGQMKLSFGMIFSIVLIIIFIAFAFYAIKKFIGLQQTIQIEKFADDLNKDVNTMWKSPKGSQEETYSLPKKIIEICFEDKVEGNLILRTDEYIPRKNIEYIDISKITEDENPYCIPNIDGQVKLIIQKDYGENLVTIIRNNGQ